MLKNYGFGTLKAKKLVVFVIKRFCFLERRAEILAIRCAYF
jgi:hypothetical protein